MGAGGGYSGVNVLHPNWSPPTRNVRHVPRATGHRQADVARTHRAVSRLGMRLRNTVVVVYCRKLSAAEAAVRLECTERTVRERIARAHRELREFLQVAADRV